MNEGGEGDQIVVICPQSKYFYIQIFRNFQKDQTIAELHAKDVKFICVATRKTLQKKLENEVKNKQKEPEIIF